MTEIKAVIFDYDGVLSHWLRKDKAMYDFVAVLQSKGLRTGILSNQYKPIALIVRRLHHLDGFDPVIISCEVGTAKPRPQIYQRLLDTLQLPAEACVFIDNRSRNVQGAKACGLKTVLAKNTPQVIHDVMTFIHPNQAQSAD